MNDHCAGGGGSFSDVEFNGGDGGSGFGRQFGFFSRSLAGAFVEFENDVPEQLIVCPSTPRESGGRVGLAMGIENEVTDDHACRV